MSISASGTQVATLGTAHTLATVATAGTYVLHVDTAELAGGETLTVEIKTRVLAGGTTRRVYSYSWVGQQPDQVKVSPPIRSEHELIVVLQQDGGTGRSFPWELVRLDA